MGSSDLPMWSKQEIQQSLKIVKILSLQSIGRDKEIELVKKISLNVEMKSLFKHNDNCQGEQCPFPFCSLCRTLQDLVGRSEPSGCHQVYRGRCFNVDYTPHVGRHMSVCTLSALFLRGQLLLF